MATVDEVSQAVSAAALALLQTNDTFPPYQVGIGWPFAISASEILGQYQAQVTVFPLTQASRNRTSRKPKYKTMTQPAPTLVATVAIVGGNQVITFSGTNTAGLNIHTFPLGSVVDCYYQTLSGDTLDSIATAVAEAVNSQRSATASGATVTVTGLGPLICNVGGAGTMSQEARRTMTPIQVSVWAADGPTRNAMSAQLESLALATNPFLYASDGSAIWIRMRGAPYWVDQSQSSYSLYESHIVFECEYPSLQTTAATTVESMATTVGTEPTTYVGGS